MTPSEELFKLIKSLSKNEKRYFSLYATVNAKQQIQTKLFDIISEMETYDEVIVKKKLGKTIDSKRLSSEKVYLFNLILKCLRQYKSETSDIVQTRNYVTDLYELYDRGLYKSCVRLLDKAEQHSFDMDQLNTIYEIKLLTIRFMNGSVKFREFFKKSFEDVERELEDVADELFIHAQLYTAHRRLFGLQMRNAIPSVIRATEEFVVLSKQIDALQNAFHTSINKKFFLQCRSLIHFFNENLDEALVDQQEILRLLNDGNMKRSHLKQRSFIQISCNAVFLLIEKNQLEEAEKLANEIISLEKEFESLPPAIFYQGCVLPRVQLVEIALRKGELDNVQRLADDLDNFVDYDITQIPSNAPNIVLSTLIEARIVNNEFRKANRVLLKLKEIPESSRSRTLRIPLYEALIHFQQGNHELLPGIAKGFAKKLKQDEISSPWLTSFFELLIALNAPRIAPELLQAKKDFLLNNCDTTIRSTVETLGVLEKITSWTAGK